MKFKNIFHHHHKDKNVDTHPRTTATTTTATTEPKTTSVTSAATDKSAPAGTTSTSTSQRPLAPTTYSSALNPPTSTISEQPHHTQKFVGMGENPVREESQALPQQTSISVVQREPVVQEQIQQVEKELIQPVIHRERQQTEVHQVTQPLLQTEIRPVITEERVLPSEVRPTIREQVRELPQVTAQSSTVVGAPMVQVMEEGPRIEETIRRTIREEIQPVIYKETVMPKIVHQVQPIYEKIIDAPIIYREERAPIILNENETFSGFFGGQQPKLVNLGQGQGIGGQPPSSMLETKLQNLELRENKQFAPTSTQTGGASQTMTASSKNL